MWPSVKLQMIALVYCSFALSFAVCTDVCVCVCECWLVHLRDDVVLVEIRISRNTQASCHTGRVLASQFVLW